MENIYTIYLRESDGESKTCHYVAVAKDMIGAAMTAIALAKKTEGMKRPEITSIYLEGPRAF